MIEWIIIFMALAGAYLNARQDRRGFVLWMITNFYLCLHNWTILEYAQGTLFAVYFFLAVFGYINWKQA